jgi:hypothetical protein
MSRQRMIARERPKRALSPPAIAARAVLDCQAHGVDELIRGAVLVA